VRVQVEEAQVQLAEDGVQSALHDRGSVVWLLLELDMHDPEGILEKREAVLHELEALSRSFNKNASFERVEVTEVGAAVKSYEKLLSREPDFQA